MQHRHLRHVLATALVLSSGCGLIQVNGKPLGGGSSPPPGPTPTAQAGGGTPAAGAPSAAPPSTAGTTPAADPSRLCAAARPNNDGTLAELDEKLASIASNTSTSRWTMSAKALTDAMCATSGQLAQQRAAVIARKNKWMAASSFDDRDFATLYTYDPNSADFEAKTGPLAEYLKVKADSYQSGRMDVMDRLGLSASMMAHVALVQGCYSLRETSVPSERLGESLKSHSLMNTILCTRIPIDVRKAWAEIDAVKDLLADRRVDLRQLAVVAQATQAAAKVQLAALAKEEPGVAKLVAIADAEFKDWAAPSAKRVALVKQLEAVEAASTSHKRSDAIDCEDKTHAAWAAHVKSLKLPTVSEKDPLETYLTSTLASADGYLAWVALRTCLTTNRPGSGERDKGRPGLHSNDYTFGLHVERRGPWSSTVVAWTTAGKSIVFDDRRRSLKDLLMAGKLGGYDNRNMPEAESGVIATVKDVEGGVEVKFKTVREPRVTCTRTETTNRIRNISPAGNVTYETICVATAKVMTDITARPVQFDKALSRGLTPGLFLIAIDGLPIVATRSPGSETPVFVLGAKLN